MEKRCTVCKESKPLNAYYNSKRSADGKQYRCKDCDNEARKSYIKNNKDSHRASQRRRNLKHKYGITLEDYERMFEAQDGGCAICGSTNGWSPAGTQTLSVDHCHKTGKVRGLLCNYCNRAIGLLRDCPDLIERASNYVRNS